MSVNSMPRGSLQRRENGALLGCGKMKCDHHIKTLALMQRDGDKRRGERAKISVPEDTH